VNQTQVYDSGAIRIGSAKLEVGETVDSLVDLGAMNDVQFQESYTIVKIMAGNVGQIKKKIKDHQATVSGNWLEPNLTRLNLMRGIDNYSTVAGTPVSAGTQTVLAGEWAMKQFIPFAGKNADGTVPTSISVAASTSGALTEDTDYTIGQNEKGDWGIIITNDTKVTTENQNITITSSYTPAAAKVLKTGGNTVLESRVVRLTNTNEEGKIFRITVYKAEAEQGISLPFPNDDADDPMATHVSLTGSCDTTRAAGDQLFEIYDEQGIL
jgi:hypothetical protein